MMSYALSVAINEKDVENEFRQYLTKKFGDIVFTSPFGCDGFGESEKTKLRLLCEFKEDVDLLNKVNQIRILSQVIYYIKKFEISGKPLPNIIFIADRNECFVMHTNDVFGYLGMDFDWSIAPSNAHTNTELISMMMEDEKISPFVFKVDDIDSCVDKIKDLNQGVKRLVPITPHNITEVFKYFEDKVIGKHNLDTNKMANLFVQLLINPEENYLHPIARRKTIVTKAFNEVNIKSREAFTSFFSHFSNEYTPKQREHLTAVVDRIVEDVTRRKQGEFFTPAVWVDKAHEYISSVFGENWKEEYVVWDPAWGTGNLTRDYKFKELYVSTLNYSDIETANQMGYNPEAVKFQFDFLNDDYDLLPVGLRKAIESNKKIIVLMNPPYATAGNFKYEEEKKTGVSGSIIGARMNQDKMGFAARNIYLQFIYKLIKDFNNVDLCMFTPPTFISSESNKPIYDLIVNKMNFKKGFIIDAANFADVKSWGLSFSILSHKK